MNKKHKNKHTTPNKTHNTNSKPQRSLEAIFKQFVNNRIYTPDEYEFFYRFAKGKSQTFLIDYIKSV